MAKVLRPHQEKAIQQIRLSFGQGNRRTVMQGATGLGKTLIAANLILMTLSKNSDARVIFTVPQTNLIDQTVKAFKAEGIDAIGVMQGNHSMTDQEQPIQVCTLQTLDRRDLPKGSLVIIDECHLDYPAIGKLFDHLPDAFFVGLSATPWRKGMGHIWHDLQIPITISELIDKGYLSKFTVFAPTNPDMTGVKTVNGDFAVGETEKVMEDADVVGDIIGTWLGKGQNRPTLCFCVNRAHASFMHDKFERAGIASAYVDGNTDRKERDLVNQRFRDGEIKIVCSVRTMTTGVDLPVSCIIDAAPTKSEMLHVQKIGRGLRVNEGTEDLIILDHAGNSYRNGLVTDIHHDSLDTSEKGEKQIKKAKKLPKECSSCGVVFSGLVCPSCGHERKPIPGVENAEGELIEITPTKLPAKEEKQDFWSMALWYARHKGYRKGWASHKYRDKFGVWNKGLSDVPKKPDQAFMNYIKHLNIANAKRREKRNA